MNETARKRINLLRPLLKDTSQAVRAAAADAIDRLEATSGVEEILATLKTGTTGAKIGAIYALGEIGGEQVLTPLVYCARRAEVDIRSAAVAVLGKLAAPSVLPVLSELLDDESPIVQGRVIEALRSFAVDSELRKKLRLFLNASDGVLEAEAALTLAVLKDIVSLEQICTLLDSPHASTREAAASALCRMPLQ
jgi:HEAT repeat protein